MLPDRATIARGDNISVNGHMAIRHARSRSHGVMAKSNAWLTRSTRASNRSILALFVVLAGVLFAPVATAQPTTLVLDHQASSQSLDGHIEVIFDGSMVQTLHQINVSKAWRSVGPQPYSKGLERGAVWLRFRIGNRSAKTIERILQVGEGRTDEVTAWITNGTGQTLRFNAGEDTPLTRRNIHHFTPQFKLSLGPGQESHVLLRMYDEGTMNVSIQVATVFELQQDSATDQWIAGLMTGVFALVSIYTLLLFIRLRWPVFGWLAGLAMASLLQWLFFHWGHVVTWLPLEDRTWLSNRLIVSSLGCTAFFSFHFYTEASNLREHHPTLDRVIKTFGWIGLANAVLIFLVPYVLGVRVIFLAALGLFILLIAICIRAIKGDPVSKRLVLAASCLVVGYVLTVLTEEGALPPTTLSPHFIPMGTLFQWVLLSEAVSVRASQLADERRAVEEAQLEEERRASELREAFGRYVAPGLAAKILEDPEAMAPGGRLQTVTILMSDLRGFTGMTQRLGPRAMCELLNDYLGRMTEVIERHGGMVNEFIGDAILALFGTPVESDDDALNACRCAVEMQMVLNQMNGELTAAGRPTLEMGIGLHTGEAVVGNIGSDRRVKWGVIGDTVNMTGRIEALTVGTQVLISAKILELVDAQVITGAHRQVKVKGRARELEVIELESIIGENLVMPTRKTIERNAVEVDGEVVSVKEKELVGDPTPVRFVELSLSEGVFESATPFEEGADLCLRLRCDGQWTGRIYGKVTTQPGGQGRATLIFTSMDPGTNTSLERLLG